MTTAAQIDSAGFYDRWAPDYDKAYQDRADTKAEDRLVGQWLSEALPATASILDVGCGTGWFVDRTLWPRATYLGFDNSTGMLDRARAKYGGHRFEYGDAHDPWPAFPNDQRGKCERIAVSLWVLNHCDGPLVMRRYAESDADRLLAIVRTGLDRAGTALGHDDVPHTPWTLADAERAGALADWKGFRYGGEQVGDPDRAHYLWLEYRQ